MPIARRQFFRFAFTGLGAAAALPVLNLPAEAKGFGWTANWRSLQMGGPSGPVRLDSNENAYGPSPQAFAALQGSAEMANRYPRREYGELVEAIAARHGVKPEQVVVGCGSAEDLRMTSATFLGPGKTLIMASPTFELPAQQAQRLGAQVVSVPLTRDFAHDLDGMLAHAATGSGLVYICNPNNPTATLTPRGDLETFLSKLPASYAVLMDEAYHHFVTSGAPAYTSFLDRAVESDRLIVTRTFSKIYGLAGARIGYAVAVPETARRLAAQKMDYALSILSARAALAAWNDTGFVPTGAARNAADRQEFYRQAKTRSLPVIESQTNFLMVQTGRPAEEMIAHFRQNNVLIGRPFPPMNDYVRVSLGTPTDMEQFWRVWDLLPAKAQPA
jgi:histidinol-phosphate aminotransferase